jgi:hypothetical protein
MRWTRASAAALAAVTATSVLGACTGSRGGGNSAAVQDGGTAPHASARTAGGAAYGSDAPASGGKATATGLVLGAAKIRRVELTVAIAHAADVAAAADKAGSVADQYGGEVYGDDRTAGAHARATVILKIPPTDLRPALRDLAALGHERSRSSSTQDVTQRVTDVDSRVRSLTTEIATLQELYRRPGQPLSAVLEVEQTLAQRQADLEALQAEQRALQRETAMATVTLGLVTAAAATPVKHSHSATGFLGGLRRGWDAFVTGATHVATAAGAMLPFVVLLLLLAGAARLAGVRRPRRRVRPAE